MNAIRLTKAIYSGGVAAIPVLIVLHQGDALELNAEMEGYALYANAEPTLHPLRFNGIPVAVAAVDRPVLVLQDGSTQPIP
jgi:hypothetical protein